MKQLSHEAFERARRFLVMQARPLERALFEHWFEEAAVDDLLEEILDIDLDSLDLGD